MALYRKKVVELDAIQFIPGESEDILGVEWDSDNLPFIRTLEGPLRVSPWDWIITGIKGEKYPCKPDIFETLYERVV